MINFLMKFRDSFLMLTVLLLFASSIFATAKRLDFDGDGKTDYAVLRPTNGNYTWYILRSSDFTYSAYQWGLATDQPVPEDYDGDGKTDIVVYRRDAGQCYDVETQTTRTMNVFYVLSSQSGNFQYFCWGSGIVPRPEFSQDFDGDGKVDPTYVIHIGGASAANLQWKVLKSSTSYQNFSVIQPLNSSDAYSQYPVPGDYDGDGKADAAIADRSGGNIIHRIKRSSDGNLMNITFGLSGQDTVVPGDYDGDGKTDIAVRRNYGNSFDWYVLNSSNETVSYIVGFGTRLGGDGNSPDEPIIGDYDGDNKADIAVVRRFNDPNCGNQKCVYIIGSSSGFFGVQWGLLSDKDFGVSY